MLRRTKKSIHGHHSLQPKEVRCPNGSFESISNRWTDYTTLLTLLPASSPSSREVRRSLEAIKPRVEAAQKQETAEMLDKLKGLGNSILGA